MTTFTKSQPAGAFSYIAVAFADYSLRQVIASLGLLDLCSRGPKSPRWQGISADETAQKIDAAAVAAYGESELTRMACPRYSQN